MAEYVDHNDVEEAIGGPDFGTTSTPTATNVDDMAIGLGRMWDGLADQAALSETPDQFVKAAIVAACVYQVGQIRKGEPIDVLVQIRIMKEFMSSANQSLSYTQSYPESSGEW